MIKTIITIGPNSLSEDDILKFMSHSNLFRLNGSHSNVQWHKAAVSLIRKVCPDAFILMDIPGIKPRTANTNNIEIKKGEIVCFGENSRDRNILVINLTKALPRYESTLRKFSINDGQFLFDVIEVGKSFVIGRARESFTLLPKKGINLPGSVYDDKQQFNVYTQFIESIKKLEIDALGLSFIQNADVVNKIRLIHPEPILISKVENSEGLRNCAEIAEASDAVMVDRGDLVAEIGYQHLFSGIEEISRSTKLCGKPLIMATENLESMINRDLPSKSEVVSLAHSASIGVDCFMLSEETATSDNAHIIVSWLSEFLAALSPPKISKTLAQATVGYKADIWKSMRNYSELPTLIMSKSGRAVETHFSQNQHSQSYVLTDNQRLAKLCKLYCNVITVFEASIGELPIIELIWKEINKHKETIFLKHDKILAVYVSKYTKTPRANTITIFQKDDFL